MAEQVTPLEHQIRDAEKAGVITADHPLDKINQAEQNSILTKEEANQLRIYDSKVMDLIAVDEFDDREFGKKPAAKSDAGRTSRAG